jgi:hypothetical protein
VAAKKMPRDGPQGILFEDFDPQGVLFEDLADIEHAPTEDVCGNLSGKEALADLKKRLEAIFSGRPRQLAWGAPECMRESLARVRARFSRRSCAVPRERVTRGVLAVRMFGQKADFVHLKYACYGIAQHADLNARRLLEDSALVKKLLSAIETLQGDRRRYEACRRGLLRSWQEAEKLPKLPASREGRTLLKNFLFPEQKKS